MRSERDREKGGDRTYKDDRELKSELPAGSMKVGSETFLQTRILRYLWKRYRSRFVKRVSQGIQRRAAGRGARDKKFYIPKNSRWSSLSFQKSGRVYRRSNSSSTVASSMPTSTR